MTILLITRRQFERLLEGLRSKVKGAANHRGVGTSLQHDENGHLERNLGGKPVEWRAMWYFAMNQIWAGNAGEAMASLGRKSPDLRRALNELIAAIAGCDAAGGSRRDHEQRRFGDIHERLLEAMNRAIAGSLRCGCLRICWLMKLGSAFGR